MFQAISICKGPFTSILGLCPVPITSIPRRFSVPSPFSEGMEARRHSFRTPSLFLALCHMRSVKPADNVFSIWSVRPEKGCSKDRKSGPIISQWSVTYEQHLDPKMPHQQTAYNFSHQSDSFGLKNNLQMSLTTLSIYHISPGPCLKIPLPASSQGS